MTNRKNPSDPRPNDLTVLKRFMHKIPPVHDGMRHVTDGGQVVGLSKTSAAACANLDVDPFAIPPAAKHIQDEGAPAPIHPGMGRKKVLATDGHLTDGGQSRPHPDDHAHNVALANKIFGEAVQRVKR